MRDVWALALLFSLGACDDGGGADDPNPDTAVADAAAADLGGAPDVVADLDVGPDAAADPDAEPDAGPDARIPVQAAERPTEGPADLPGADDLTALVPPGRARAGRVTEDAERITGPEARCRIGHFRLDNARISVCLQAEDAFSQVSNSGGNIIDAIRADRPGTDRFGEMYVAPGLGEVTVEEIGIVADGSDGGSAILRTAGHVDGSRLVLGYLTVQPAPAYVITEYRLAPDTDWVDVYTWIGAEDRFLSMLGAEFLLFGDQTRGFIAGATSAADTPAISSLMAASADQVSYGWSRLDGDLSFLRVPLDEFPLAPVNYGQLQLGAYDDVLFKRRFTVGTGDIESVRVAPMGAVAVTFSGPPGAEFDIDDGAASVTRVRLDDDGARVAMLVPGDYRAASFGWIGGDVPPIEFSVAGPTAVDLPLPGPGTLRLRVRDQDGGLIGVQALMIKGADDRRENFVDELVRPMPAGTWRIVTTRGWHYSADDREVPITAGAESVVDVVLTEAIPFEGWTSGDFHQHASPSLDSAVSVEARVMSNVGSGIGFMTPTDHDQIFLYAPVIEALGMRDYISSPIGGVEISPLKTHINAFGIEFTPGRDAGGCPPLAIRPDGRWRKATIPELVAEARARGAEIVQINHPRATQGYFDLVHYNSTVDVSTKGEDVEWTTDFDSVEVYNERADFCRVMGDWMGLLRQGIRIVGVGNSDTHSLSAAAGYPRNYLPTAADAPRDVTREEIVAALRAGQVSVGGGAYLDLPDGPMFGDEVAVEGTFSVRVRVRTPPWTRVHRLLAFLNGETVLDLAFDGQTEDIVDIDEVVDVPVDRDGPLVFLALGDRNMPYFSNDPVFAFGNPIWLDADGDGEIAQAGAGEIVLPAMTICD